MTATTITRIATWLPCFPGFYNTAFDQEFDNELDYLKNEASDPLPESADVGDLLYGWNNTGYELAVVRCICKHIPRYFPSEAGILKCELEAIVSPKEYNFTNDSANVTFEIDMAVFGPWLRGYLKQHADAWASHLRSHYQSRDGFMSFYSHHADDWQPFIDALIDGTEPPITGRWYNGAIPTEHLAGRLFEFVLESERAKQTDEPLWLRMYYDVSDHVYVGEFIDIEKVKQHISEKSDR